MSKVFKNLINNEVNHITALNNYTNFGYQTKRALMHMHLLPYWHSHNSRQLLYKFL